jgi:hypothetical protein
LSTEPTIAPLEYPYEYARFVSASRRRAGEVGGAP